MSARASRVFAGGANNVPSASRGRVAAASGGACSATVTRHRDRTQESCGRVVTLFENVRQRVLGQAPDPVGEEIDDREGHPAPDAEPEHRKARSEGQPGAGKQAAGADPGADQRAGEEPPGGAAARHHEVFLRVHRSASVHADRDKEGYVANNAGEIDVHGPVFGVSSVMPLSSVAVSPSVPVWRRNTYS